MQKNLSFSFTLESEYDIIDLSIEGEINHAKQTICFVEPGDIIYLIDDNFEIKQLELYPTHLDASLDDRSCISDEVDTVSTSLVLASPEVKDDQLDLLEVYLDTNDFGSLI